MVPAILAAFVAPDIFRNVDTAEDATAGQGDARKSRY